MIKRLGWRGFLRLFWGTFQRKYFPTAEQLKTDLRSSSQLDRDQSDGQSMITSVLLGASFVGVPVVALLLRLGAGSSFADLYLDLVVIFICFGVIFLAFPIGVAISLMIKMEKHADEFFDGRACK